MAGFTDADGNFYIRITEMKLNPNRNKNSRDRIAIRFSIEQQSIHAKYLGSYKLIMEKLAKYFSVQLSNRNYTSGKMNYVFSVSTENKLQKVVDYFN